jgi:uncharacterized protein YecE (DUF72 family)
MKNHLGPLMFQFEYLNKKKMPSQEHFIGQFERFISRCPKEYQYGVEIRNPNYLNESYFRFLNQHKLGHVFLQGYYMPPIHTIYNQFSELIDNMAIIRLHGPDRKKIEDLTKKTWNDIVLPKDDDLSWIIPMIQHIMDRNIDIYVNVNNHFEGSAPLTIKKIQDQINNRSQT